MRTLPLTNRGLHLPTIVTLGLLTVLAALLASAPAVSAQGGAPDTPDRPTGTAVFVGGVDLEWNDVPGADSYDVQLYRNGQWIDLPGDGVEVAFYGAGAIIRELDPTSSLWFHVRARNAHGISGWSDFNFMSSTNQHASGRQARPDNVVATGAPVINGTAQVRETLTADTTDIDDGNGLDRVKFRYQWVANVRTTDTDISGATSSTYTLVAADQGRTIKVRVSFTDRGGYAESLTSDVTEAVPASPNSPATGAPAITGTAQVGKTLTADTAGIADDDGLSGATFSHQWVANDGTADTDIAGATDSSYNLLGADEGKTIRVRVSFTDDAANEESLTSDATAVVAARPNSPATGAPTITGTAQVGETLTADVAGIADDDGLSGATFNYQWISNDGTTDTDITGATSSSYTLVAADEGKSIKVRVSFTDDAGFDETLTSTATEEVSFAVQQQRANSPATGGPAITGTAQVGETLTADTSGIADADGLTNVTFSYQWVANDGTSDADIAGATDSTYTLAAADEGKTIKVRVAFTDRGGYAESLTSAATAAVAARANSPATGAPSITGTAQVGETLTADTSGITDADGLSGVTFSYQWLADDADIAGATDSTYTLVAADEGKAIKVKVSFTDEANHQETLTSTATAAVTAVPNSPATGAPVITGTAQVGETLTADTSGIADSDGLSNVSYSYQWIRNDGSSDSDIQNATGFRYTLVDADESKTIKLKVSFTDDSNNNETLTSVATALVISASEGASGQSESGGMSYITVVVTEDTSDHNNIVTNFNVIWSDSDDCSTNYNAYLNITPSTSPGHETPGSQHHLGSTASDGTRLTKGLTGVHGLVEGFNVEVYCGTDSSGRMVSKIDIPWSAGRPKTGTYSSQPPLSALSGSHGTLTPAFNSYTSSYTVPDVANDETRITITATPKSGYAVDFYEWAGTDSVWILGYSFGPGGPPSGLSEGLCPCI